MDDRGAGPREGTEFPAGPDATARPPETFLTEDAAQPGASINEEKHMQQESLTALVSQHLETASKASSGRSAHTVYGGHEHVLRQTLIALRAVLYIDAATTEG